MDICIFCGGPSPGDPGPKSCQVAQCSRNLGPDGTGSKQDQCHLCRNGELLGNFPDFALHRAWITQGTEVLNWLDQALSKKNSS